MKGGEAVTSRARVSPPARYRRSRRPGLNIITRDSSSLAQANYLSSVASNTSISPPQKKQKPTMVEEVVPLWVLTLHWVTTLALVALGGIISYLRSSKRVKNSVGRAAACCITPGCQVGYVDRAVVSWGCVLWNNANN